MIRAHHGVRSGARHDTRVLSHALRGHGGAHVLQGPRGAEAGQRHAAGRRPAAAALGFDDGGERTNIEEARAIVAARRHHDLARGPIDELERAIGALLLGDDGLRVVAERFGIDRAELRRLYERYGAAGRAALGVDDD